MTIEFYNSIASTCFICAAVFAILTLVLIIFFDVKSVFRIKTGSHKRKEIAKMIERCRVTGKLRDKK